MSNSLSRKAGERAFRSTRGRAIDTEQQRLIELRARHLPDFVTVHAICVISNHNHLIATDSKGKLPLFTQYFHRLLTTCVQKLRGWDEVVWKPGKRTSMVELLDGPAVIEKTLYALCNPIKAGICRKEHQWPGNVLQGRHELQRPDCFKSRIARGSYQA